MKVCVIDDNKSITGMLNRLLKMKGHEPTIINDGQKGLQALETETFDVVTLDVAMPEFSGIDVLQSLNENNTLQNQKIVILTASSVLDKELDKLLTLGAKKILKKPVNVDTLVSDLEAIAKAS